MVNKRKSENSLTHNACKDSTYKEKCHKAKDFKKCTAKMGSIINGLETSILQSNENDRQLFMVAQRDNLRYQKLTYQLDAARKENALLLSALQLEGDDGDPFKSRSQVDYLSSYSTISMVHLQYKYEELLSSHEGLLKVLESKVKDSQKCYCENEELRDEIQKLYLQVSDDEKTVATLCDKYLKLKQRKDTKILGLKYERDTLRMAHNQVVNLLNEKCLLDDGIDCSEPQESLELASSFSLKEAKLLCNELQHENLRLLRENEFLKNQIKQISERSCK